jgi:uncharacterized membrane protein
MKGPKILTWPRTYVVAALGSIATYCIMFPFMGGGSRRD